MIFDISEYSRGNCLAMLTPKRKLEVIKHSSKAFKGIHSFQSSHEVENNLLHYSSICNVLQLGFKTPVNIYSMYVAAVLWEN